MSADWAWLWLYNDYTRQYELTTSFSATGAEKFPPVRTLPGVGSVADCCFQTEEPKFVDNVSDWSEEHSGQLYGVTSVSRAALNTLGCECFDAVPLLAPIAKSGPHAPQSQRSHFGVITAHYTSKSKRQSQQKESLLLMGRLTAVRVHDTYMQQQREILLRLNDLARRDLSNFHLRPKEVRRDYLDALIKLLQTTLGVRCVTVFYRSSEDGTVSALASTGLYRLADGTRVPPDEFDLVAYRPGEGQVGDFLLSKTAEQKARVAQTIPFVEEFAEALPNGEGTLQSSLIYPIMGLQDSAASSVVGLIRLTGLPARLYPEQERHFDPIEAQTIKFITEQVGLVLDALERGVQRERTISIVKHDLYVPLNMIRDTVHKIERSLKQGKAASDYDIKNLGVVHLLGRNLVDQLDPDPGEVQDFSLTRTFLEGDIVARLCNLLGHYAREMKGMSIEYEGFRDVPAIMVDRLLIERAIANLILNAVKYGKKHTVIKIVAHRTTDGYKVFVSNFGIGVEPADEPRLFSPGFRSRRARKQAGVGLGLWITRQIMRKHGGDAQIECIKDPTVFSLFFPESLEARYHNDN